jgi:hypothetical protein
LLPSIVAVWVKSAKITVMVGVLLMELLLEVLLLLFDDLREHPASAQLRIARA